MTFVPNDVTAAVRDGLAFLGIRRMVLAIHDACFPSTPDEDTGRGSPYGKGARKFFVLARSLGFGGVQLGPQGDTAFTNSSPYDGALFTKNPMGIAPATLREDPQWEALCAGLPDGLPHGLQDDLRDGAGGRDFAPHHPTDRVGYGTAWRAARARLKALHARFAADTAAYGDLAARFTAYKERHASTLEADGDFEALATAHQSDDWRTWPELDQRLHWPPGPSEADARAGRRLRLRNEGALDIERHAFGQFILKSQHEALRRATAASGPEGVALYGDLQIGISHRDLWSRRAMFLGDYVLGAPPSRTNPGGQAWGYPVLDPQQYSDPTAPDGVGAALRLLLTRVQGMLEDFDGLRIDHPHGLVCPWVYAAGDADPGAAVARGARLFCSPNLADHARLSAFAIPGADQLSRDPSTARYADDWVRELSADQVGRYGVLFDAVMASVSAAGRLPADVVCEVLSTWPRPLREVMERHGLGRFCVTQKADLTRDDDVYRSENVSPRDWIMVGNHDTQPIWQLAEAWHGTAAGTKRVEHLSRLLIPDPAIRPTFARWLAADGRHLAQAMFAELFASRAGNISVFFADLFGSKEIYNRPGVVHGDNWSLRLPSDFEGLYQRRLREGGACNVPFALALGVLSRSSGDAAARARQVRVARDLFAVARRLTPAFDPIATVMETASGVG